MPGTGPLRRSSAAARKKAIVDKSRIGAGLHQSPRFVFLAFLGIAPTVFSALAEDSLGRCQFELAALAFSLFGQGFHVEIAMGFEPVLMNLDR